MGPLFRKTHSSLFRFVLAASVALVGVVGILGWAVIRSSWQTEVGHPVDQKIPFSHEHHVSGLGIDCRFCHTTVTRSAFAGLPSSQVCMTCHSQIWQDAPMLRPLRESFAQNIPLRWNRVYRLPKYVYFDHSIHVNKGVGCTSCHEGIQNMPLTWKSQPFYMKDCLKCHREPEKYLRPQSEVFNVHWTPPAKVSLQLVHKNNIPQSRLTDCYTCHR